MLQEYILKKLADAAFNQLSVTLHKAKGKPTSSVEVMEAALQSHLREVKNWSNEISFADLRVAKRTSATFVPLDLFLQPQRSRLAATETSEVRPLERVLNESRSHVIILGQPGAGKTTSMKHLCQRLLTEDSFLPSLNFPVLIRLREMRAVEVESGEENTERDLLFSNLQIVLGIEMAPVSRSLQAGDQQSGLRSEALAEFKLQRRRLITSMLDTLGVLLILDGFDEVSSSTARENLVDGLRFLATQLEKTRLVLTSRTGDFPFHIEKMVQFEIHSLRDDQITTFAARWLGREAGRTLVAQLKLSPYSDTAIRPLTLAHICAIYERTGAIPERPKSIYRKIVSLLIETWDEQRSVKRSSSYARFDVDVELEFLSHLAYVLTVTRSASLFSRVDLLAAYAQIYQNFGLPQREALQVVQELESHTGLILQSGAEMFEFSHKSLQEFLAAEYIVRLPSLPKSPTELPLLPYALAVSVAISSRPSEYLLGIVRDCFPAIEQYPDFIRSFTSRLLLEKPDFEHNERTTAALTCLYSRYLEALTKHHGHFQQRLHEGDTTLDKLCEIVEPRLRDGMLLEGFSESGPMQTYGNVGVLRLFRKSDEGLSIYGSELPMILFVRVALEDD